MNVRNVSFHHLQDGEVWRLINRRGRMLLLYDQARAWIVRIYCERQLKWEIVVRAMGTAQRWSAQYASHLELLRSNIDAGTYQIDNTALARCILIKETHFL